MALKLYNSLSHKKEIFRPIKKRLVGLYTCGPTVYQYAHIGNLRTYIFADLLKRTLLFNGYRVKHVINITDVGHLTSDADTGEDKIEREAAKQRKNARGIARFYESAFKKDLQSLNIIPPSVWARATAHIREQIRLIQQLEQKGFTYRTSDGMYFDTIKFARYAPFNKANLKGIQAGKRVATGQKRHATDFALWKFSPEGVKRDMEWPSPWGIGFPGWHVECSAMSIRYLGRHFDIHTGGIDHIAIHHTNEIAQSEAATGTQFVNFWMHGNFLQLGKARMGKSAGNFITLETLIARGFDPLDFRYLMLTAHYRSPLTFTFKALGAARAARLRLLEYVKIIKTKWQASLPHPTSLANTVNAAFLKEINNDLSIPQALAIARRHIKKNADSPRGTLATVAWFDQALGLRLLESADSSSTTVPATIQKLIEKREALRNAKQWKSADNIRKIITKQGWRVDDMATGPRIAPL